MSICRNCGATSHVCENHPDKPWGGISNALEACDCGAGAPCPCCDLGRAAAGLVEPWRELADRAIERVESAVQDTNWGQPTFGPDYGEEMRAEYDAMLAHRTPKTEGEG